MMERRCLLIGTDARDPEAAVVLTVTAEATQGPDVCRLARGDLPGSARFDLVLLSVPPAAAAAASALLDFAVTRLEANGLVLATASGLCAAAQGDCFPPGSAEVVLGASGLDAVPAPINALADVRSQVPRAALAAWAARHGAEVTEVERSEIVAARLAPPLSFVTPSIDDDTLHGNLLRSRAVQAARNELLVERRGPRVQAALNAGLARAANDLIVVAHEDVYLPPLWEGMFRRSVRQLERRDPEWGVVGCAGVRRRFGLLRVRRRGLGHSRDPGGSWGQPFDEPEPIDTLDEFLIAFRRRRGLRFDEQQPNYHFYAADLCLQAAARGWRSYAIEAFCYHNSYPSGPRHAPPPPDFLAGCEYMRAKWAERLPIVTTCTVIARDPRHDHHAKRLRRRAAATDTPGSR